MVAKRTLLALAMLCHALAHALHSRLRDPPPRAEVYVINLKSRVDKCYCMQKQLKTLPWPAHRFEAFDRETVYDACPLMMRGKGLGKDQVLETVQASMALVCSNYIIWKQFLKYSSAEHLIIFEDDAAILDDSIWATIENMFDSPCSPWDYLLVDPSGFERTTVVPGCEKQKMYDLTYDLDGSHMQVFTRQAVTSLTEWMHYYVNHYGVGPPVADKMVRKAGEHLWFNLTNVRALNAGVVTQAESYESVSHQPLQCQKTVATEEDRQHHFDSTLAPVPFDC